jgi:hypothetical protein
MRKPVALAVFLVLTSASSSFAQECLHGASEQAAQRSRREQALQTAIKINLAETVIVGPQTGKPKYRPLEQLLNVPPTPTGFALRFYTDGSTYAFSLKDTLDPCHYAIFSDQDKGIYDGTPRTGVRVVPVTQ